MLSCRRETLTPKKAAEFRASGRNSRNLNAKHAAYLAEQIRSGKWKENGDTIRFDTFDRMIDGQHRCEAVILSGISIDVLVVRGVKASADDTIDTGGRSRNFTEWVATQGYTYAGVWSSVCNHIVKAAKGIAPGTQPTNATRIAMSELKAAFQKHKVELAPWVELGSSNSSLPGCGTFSYFFYLFSQKDAALAMKFARALLYGEGDFPLSDPVMQLRSQLLKNMRSAHKMSTTHKAALCVKAWNYWRAGRECRVLRWLASGPGQEDFPTVE